MKTIWSIILALLIMLIGVVTVVYWFYVGIFELIRYFGIEFILKIILGVVLMAIIGYCSFRLFKSVIK